MAKTPHPVDSPHKSHWYGVLMLFAFSQANGLNNHSSCRWFQTPWRPCDVSGMYLIPSYHSRAVVQYLGNTIQHHSDVIMGAMASQITCVSIVCLIVRSGTGQWKHQSSAPLAFVRGIHRWPLVSPHKGPVTRKMFPFDDVIMKNWTCKKLVISNPQIHT